MNVAFIASSTPLALDARKELEQRYGACSPDQADVIVALGGDGLVLKTLYGLMEKPRPVFALRRTASVGFLCNDYDPDRLMERVAKAQKVILHPLRAEAQDTKGARHTTLAINEITVLRDSPQSALLRVLVDGVERLNRYSGDGILVATPAGSTAYNHSAGGPIMPLDANTLVMTSICGYRPRHWSNALLRQGSVIEIEALETDKRPVRLEAGSHAFPNLARTRIHLDLNTAFTLLFDPGQTLGERIVQEQFRG